MRCHPPADWWRLTDPGFSGDDFEFVQGAGHICGCATAFAFLSSERASRIKLMSVAMDRGIVWSYLWSASG